MSGAADGRRSGPRLPGAARRLGDVLRGGPRPVVRALNGVSLAIDRGETLAVVGESGCGKSTLARALVRLIELDAGQIDFDGEDVRGAARARRCAATTAASRWCSRTRTARSTRA